MPKLQIPCQSYCLELLSWNVPDIFLGFPVVVESLHFVVEWSNFVVELSNFVVESSKLCRGKHFHRGARNPLPKFVVEDPLGNGTAAEGKLP